MRKLASIREIAEIKVHPNADALELAIVDGWQCVVKKGEFKAGDLVVYLEVDSVVPIRPEYEFLRKGCYVKKDWLPEGEGFRLKTIKLRGQISQGLVLPLEKKEEHAEGWNWIKNSKGSFDTVLLGDDVTDNLGVVKWDPPLAAQLQGQAKGNFPSFIPKTDQERAQNLTKVIQQANLDGDLFEVTMKLDGSSCTMFHNDGEVGVCSRNLQLKVNEENADNTFVRMLNETGMAAWLAQCKRNIAVQGELMGPGIQGNREGFTETKFFIYDIYDIDTQQYFTPDEREQLVDLVLMPMGVKVYHVPVMFGGRSTTPGTIEELLEMAKGASINNAVREGLVFKRIDGGFSFKIINNDYLMGEE